jgi:Cytochrome c554 and c-prime
MMNTRSHIAGWIAFLAIATLVGASLAQVGDSESARQQAGEAYAEKEQVDPIAANGEIFVDWPKPDVAFMFSGEQDGFLEPCGCAGLENQKGGLRRRFTLLKELRDKGWPVVAMDNGGQEKRTGVQAEIKMDFACRALAKMGYAAVGFGPSDLRLDLLSILINLDEGATPLVSANVAIGGFEESEYVKRFTIVEAGGVKIGITSVLGKKELAELKNVEDLVLLEPYQAIPQVLPKLLEANCDHLVLLAHAEPDEAQDLARRFNEFDFVVTAHGAEEPPNEAAKIDGANSHLIEVGKKGMYVTVVGLYKDGQTPFRVQRVPLDSRFADAPEIHEMHVDYQQRLETLGLEGLGLKASSHPSGGKFAGSKACADCHLSATEVYENTPHFHATDTLLHLDPPRHFDPECLSCHATGWEPQRYFPFQTGFLGLKETPHMGGNGCENCHGPAARHVAAENGEIEVTEQDLEKLRAALRLKVVDNEGNKEGQVFDRGKVVQMCMQCHDLDNSPDFDFQVYWPQVVHEGKD